MIGYISRFTGATMLALCMGLLVLPHDARSQSSSESTMTRETVTVPGGAPGGTTSTSTYSRSSETVTQPAAPPARIVKRPRTVRRGDGTVVEESTEMEETTQTIVPPVEPPPVETTTRSSTTTITR